MALLDRFLANLLLVGYQKEANSIKVDSFQIKCYSEMDSIFDFFVRLTEFAASCSHANHWLEDGDDLEDDDDK